MTSSRRNRFLSSTKIPTLERNATEILNDAKTIPLTVLHERERLDWDTTQCKCMLDDIGMKLFSWTTSDISSIKHSWGLLGRKVRGLNGVNNVMDLEHTLHQKWNRIPLTMVQRLFRV